MINDLYFAENYKQFQYAPNSQKNDWNNDVRIVEIYEVGNVGYNNPQEPNDKKRPPILFSQFNVRICKFFHTIISCGSVPKPSLIKPRSVELQCHVFVEGRRKNLMSRCSNSSPRYSVRTTMPSLLILKISYVFNNKISITLLPCLICLG